MSSSQPQRSAGHYAEAGVDTAREESALQRLLDSVLRTHELRPGSVRLPIGLFANVIAVAPNLGVAISTDGVGTKVIVAQMLGKYDTIGIDLVAMNVNDLLCVGAEPVSLVDHIAVTAAEPELLAELGKGLYEGARQANITISGGEIAQVPELVAPGPGAIGFDLSGTAIGTVALDRIIVGQDVEPGDVVIGLPSSGVHSNGLTLARRVLFDRARLRPDSYVADLGRTVGEELLEPTRIYVPVAMDLLRSGVAVRALVNITSDGLLNLARVTAAVGFRLTELPRPQPIFELIQRAGSVDLAAMYEVFNQGVGFCVVVPPEDVDRALAVAARHHLDARVLGEAVADPEKRVWLEPVGLVGRGDRFAPAPSP